MFVSASEASAARPGRGHIVDVLIEERAPKLAALAGWPLVRPLLYALLDYGKARHGRRHRAASGRAALDYVSDLLALKVEARGWSGSRPAAGAWSSATIPTGVADGIAVYDALKPVRPDLIFFANADAHRVSPR